MLWKPILWFAKTWVFLALWDFYVGCKPPRLAAVLKSHLRESCAGNDPRLARRAYITRGGR